MAVRTLSAALQRVTLFNGFSGAGLVALLSVGVLSAAAPGQRADGLPRCEPGAERNLSTEAALQCWFRASHGGWRILTHDGHYDSVVYHVAADDLQDADEIARMVVASEGMGLGELVLYVYPEPIATSLQTRRISWTKRGGYQTLDFPGRAPPWLLSSLAGRGGTLHRSA